MTVTSALCPQCAVPLDRPRIERDAPPVATCRRCGIDYVLGSGGLERAVQRCSADGCAGPVTGVRALLLERYEALAQQYPQRRSWHERLQAVCAGDVLVEPGWMLRPILGADVDLFGLYRVYPDGRVERDRNIERADLERFRTAGHRARRR
jgi:hypothetical protein